LEAAGRLATRAEIVPRPLLGLFPLGSSGLVGQLIEISCEIEQSVAIIQ
jgi:hypothetical protein